VVRAVAQAHRWIGVPITTHAHAATYRGREQQRVFREEGVDLTRVIIGHAGDSTDLGYLRELMDNGSAIGMDRFGLDVMLPFAERGATLCPRVRGPHGVIPRRVLFRGRVRRRGRTALLPKWSYTHILDDVLPALRQRGVSDQQIRQMFVENPRRIFEHTGPY
jgi:phosphotriesterase-related protein